MRVEVRSRATGADGLPPVFVELAEERVAVRELIRRAVLEQLNVTAATRVRAAYGTPGVIKPPEPAVVPEAEVARAWRAFERRAFALFCGGRQAEALDETVTLRLGEPVLFLRLIPLAGG